MNARHLWIVAALPVSLALTALTPADTNRAVYGGREGVVRWRDDRQEVTLFGASFQLPTASDYRAAGYVPDRSENRL